MESLTVIPQKLNKSSQQLAIRESKGYEADFVHHFRPEEIRAITSHLKDRDRLLVHFIFDTCLRVSEALSVRPCDIKQTESGWQISILGKGRKRSAVAVSRSMVAQLHSYAYEKRILPEDRIFKINRTRVFQIVQGAMKAAGVVKPDGVGAVHILRHSGAIERLRLTGNPKAVQDQLRHRSAAMTLRYMKTLSHEESLAIQGSVDHGW